LQQHFKKRYENGAISLLRFSQFLSHSIRATKKWLAYREGKSSYYLTVGKFSDRSIEELKRIYNAEPNSRLQNQIKHLANSESIRKRSKRSLEQTIPAPSSKQSFIDRIVKSVQSIGARKDIVHVDWRNSGCLQEPVDQYECGCCYAMASVKLFEWLHCQEQHGQLVKFSEQYILDCGKLVGLKGCESGSIGKTLEFVEAHGMMLNERLPYKGEQQTCPLEDEPDKLAISSQLIFTERLSEKVLRLDEWAEKLSRQPLLVYMYVADDFFDFADGYYDNENCDRSFGHFVVLVGHGVENNREYWLFSNSYGKDWGSGGYFKLLKSKDSCIGYVLQTDAKFKQQNLHKKF